MTCAPSCLCRCEQIGCGCRDGAAPVRRTPKSEPLPALDTNTRLDREFPVGDPTAATCRHCKRRRTELNGGLFCRHCDGPALSTATGEVAS